VENSLTKNMAGALGSC